MRSLILFVTAVLLAACAQPVGPEFYYAAPTSGPVATIEGVMEDGGPMMHEHFTCVATIDGMALPKRRWSEVTKPVALTPGTHALTICYLSGNRLGKTIIRLAVQPDHAYVVRMERIYEEGILRPPTVSLWVEDKQDGKMVTVGKLRVVLGYATSDPPIVQMLSSEAPI